MIPSLHHKLFNLCQCLAVLIGVALCLGMSSSAAEAEQHDRPELTAQQPEGAWRLRVVWCRRDDQAFGQLAFEIRQMLDDRRTSAQWQFLRRDEQGITLEGLSDEDLLELTQYKGHDQAFAWDADGLQIRYGDEEQEEAAWLKQQLEAEFSPLRFDLRRLEQRRYDEQLAVMVCQDAQGGDVLAGWTASRPGTLQGDEALKLAEKCAKASTETAAFVSCMDGRVVASAEAERVLSCLEASGTSQSAFLACAGDRILDQVLAKDNARVIQCIQIAAGSPEPTLGCLDLPPSVVQAFSQSQTLMECAAAADDGSSRAECAASAFGGEVPTQAQELLACVLRPKERDFDPANCGLSLPDLGLSPQEEAALACALEARNVATEALSCAQTLAFDALELSADQRAALTCAAKPGVNIRSFSACAAQSLLGDNLDPQQQAVVACAVDAGPDATAFGLCAANDLLELGLNEEQQIGLQCVTSTGGEPISSTTCAATRLTIRELQKCATHGWDSDECYGPNNDLVGRNGWTARTLRNAWSDVTQGPGENNDVFGEKGWMQENLGFNLGDIF